MLAGPPPSFNTDTLPTTMQSRLQSSSTMFSNKFQPPLLPPNFPTSPTYPPGTHRPTHPPLPPPTLPNSQRFSVPNPPTGSENQPQFYPTPPMMVNGTNPSSANYPYSNSGPSTQMQSASIPPQQFDVPTPPPPSVATYPYPNSHSPLPNQPSLNMNGGLPYEGNQYSQVQSAYNGSSSPVATSNHSPPLPTGYSSHHRYPNLPGPPSLPGNQLNGPNTYPGQPSANGPVQPSFPQARVDPDALPNVVQILEMSQEKIQGPFITNAPGLSPPPVGTNFTCQDQGSCNPRLMRSTTYTIPNNADMIKQSNIPIALSISPLANLRPDEIEPPLSDFGKVGPVRCHRCKAYMCSFMKFIDGGKRFICCFCQSACDVPNDYFNHLDQSGRRMDWYQRPELCLGSYEMLATKQYCKDEKWPEPPAFIFMIDVSYNSVRSGLVEYICHILKNDLLNYLPKEKYAETSTVRVGFATFDKQIHFYNIKSTLSQPQMMIVSDLEDIFIPLLDGFLCAPQDSPAVINSLLEQIPQTFAHTKETETILAPVIQSGIQALKEAKCPGKIYIFSTTLPIAVAPGKLSNRDDKKALGTEREKTILSPINDIYTKLGVECAEYGCAVDLFVFSNEYYDLATIGEVCRISGGEIYKFNYFSIESDSDRLFDELKRNFQRTTVFDALMRVRTTTGIRPIDFLGNFHMTNATEIIFGTLDSDKSVCIELKHDDKLPVESNSYIQVGLLYTSISGQRRLRIITLALTVTSSYSAFYLACDLDAIMNHITKLGIRSILMSTPKSIRENIIAQGVNMLSCYRKTCAQATTAAQLILPDTLKLLPIYIASLIKSEALTGVHTLSTDDRSWLMHRLMSMNVKGTSAYLYPKIYPLHTLEENHIPPPMIRCSYERFSDTGAYVIENGLVMYIWLGSQIDPTFVQGLFGLPTVSYIQPEKCQVLELDNPISINVRTLLSIIRDERNSYMRLLVVQQRDSMEPFFRNYLVEDKGITGGASYVDFLYLLHREIKNN